MSFESKNFQLVNLDQFVAFDDLFKQFPVLDQFLYNFWYFFDYSVPRVAFRRNDTSVDAIIPTTSSTLPTLTLSSEWHPSVLDKHNLLGLGRRTSRLQLLPDHFFSSVGLLNQLQRSNLNNVASALLNTGFMPFTGAYAVEDYKFRRSEVGYDSNGSLEIPRVLSPEPHAVLYVAQESRRTDLVGNSYARNLEPIQDNTWEDQLNKYLDYYMKGKKSRRKPY